MRMKQLVPAPLRRTSRRLIKLSRDSLLDGADRLRGVRDPLVPPRRLMFVGDGDFRAVGDEFLELFVRLGGLQRDHRVLDVGSGIGRMARPLTEYLLPTASYTGIEIVGGGVRWCERHISARFPHFRFIHADVHNPTYNADGRQLASRYTFPFDSNSFDFVIVTSVFTHLRPDALDNYLREIGRVLAPGGRCFATFLLLNGDSRRLIENGESRIPFQPWTENQMVANPKVPENAIAHDEIFVREAHKGARLAVVEPIHFGYWPGRADFVSYQDIVISQMA